MERAGRGEEEMDEVKEGKRRERMEGRMRKYGWEERGR